LALLAVSSTANPKEKRHRIPRESLPVDGELKSSGLLKIFTVIFEGMPQPEQKKIKENLLEGSKILYDAASSMFEVYSAGKTELEKKKIKESIFKAISILEDVLTPMLNALLLGKTKSATETSMLHFAKGLRMVLEGGILPMLPDDAYFAKYSASNVQSTEKPKAMLEDGIKAILPMQPAGATLGNNSTSNANNAEKPK